MVGSAENPTQWDPEEIVEDKWDESDHGKASTYNGGCRCALCREANTEKMRQYRKTAGGKIYSIRRRARFFALGRLSDLHKDQFNELYREEISRIEELEGR